MDKRDNYKVCSRWIKVNYITITPRHNLYDYADRYTETPDKKRDLYIFRHGGKLYALDQFERLSYPIMFEDTDGKLTVIGGVDSTQWYKPFLLEIHPDGEYIRLWQEIA